MQPMDICPLWQESRCLWVSGLVEALAGNPVQPGRRHALSCRGERRQLPHETLSSPSPFQLSAIALLSAEDQCPGAAGTTTTDWGADNSSSFFSRFWGSVVRDEVWTGSRGRSFLPLGSRRLLAVSIFLGVCSHSLRVLSCCLSSVCPTGSVSMAQLPLFKRTPAIWGEGRPHALILTR